MEDNSFLTVARRLDAIGVLCDPQTALVFVAARRFSEPLLAWENLTDLFDLRERTRHALGAIDEQIALVCGSGELSQAIDGLLFPPQTENEQDDA